MLLKTLFPLAILLLISSCSSRSKSPIIGKWNFEHNSTFYYTVEFFEEGKVYDYTNNVNNTYSLKNDTLTIGEQVFLTHFIDAKTIQLKRLGAISNNSFSILKKVK